MAMYPTTSIRAIRPILHPHRMVAISRGEVMMPPIGRTVVDQEAVDLVTA